MPSMLVSYELLRVLLGRVYIELLEEAASVRPLTPRRIRSSDVERVPITRLTEVEEPRLTVPSCPTIYPPLEETDLSEATTLRVMPSGRELIDRRLVYVPAHPPPQ